MNPRLATQATFRGRTGPSLRDLVGDAHVQLDRHGVRAAFGELTSDDPTSTTCPTCIIGARREWPQFTHREPTRPLNQLLTEACADLPPAALALSGGVDSAVLAALLRGRVVAYTLAPSLPGYQEIDEAQAIADALGIPLRRIVVREDDYVSSLPAAIAACETPLYNLHPVSRHLLARAVRADGHDILISGDGADEIFRGDTGADYLPIVGALTRAAGLTALAPFLTPQVAAAVIRDPNKHALRSLACELGIPESIAWHPKTPRLAPRMNLARHQDSTHIAALAHHLGYHPDHPPSLTHDRDDVAWTTLSLFARNFPGLDLACVASPD